MPLTNRQKQDIVTKIRESNTFRNASTNSTLLQYLLDATIKGEELNGDVINIEFYGESDPTNANNPRVRVNVMNLRKKLELYYQSEGSDDKWQVQIEKGQYKVSFVSRESSLLNFNSYNWSLIRPYLALLISLILLLCTNLPTSIPSIWRSIISKDKVTNLYIGDMFGMSGVTSTGGRGWTRSFNVNSYSDYSNLLNEQPELKDQLEPSEYTYASSMAVISTQRLQQFFQERNRFFNIRFATKSSASDILEGDAIYVGSIGNHNRFINFFNEANKYCHLTPYSFEIKNHPTIRDTTYTLNVSSEFEEYAIASKYPAPNNTEHFVFFSRHDYGVTASVEYFTDTDSIDDFVDSYLNSHKYFSVIFKVSGQDRTNTSLKIERIILL